MIKGTNSMLNTDSVPQPFLTCVSIMQQAYAGDEVTLVSVTVNSIMDVANNLQIDRLQTPDKAVRNIGITCSNIEDLVVL